MKKMAEDQRASTGEVTDEQDFAAFAESEMDRSVDDVAEDVLNALG